MIDFAHQQILLRKQCVSFIKRNPQLPIEGSDATVITRFVESSGKPTGRINLFDRPTPRARSNCLSPTRE
jgi:hypothetical protein